MFDNILEVTNISKNYGSSTILSKLTLGLQKGTAVAITGESGGGKTTLLSIMGLLQTATTGKVMVDGHDISGLSQKKKAELRSRYFGYLFQRSRLISSLTVLENVMVPAWVSKADGDLKKKAIYLLTRFGMQHRLHYKPQELSLGQLRRVALARALLLNPPILLADEPTNDLNPMLAKTIGDSLLETRDAGTGVIFVTHDRELAGRADQILQLKNGMLYKLASEQAMQ